MPSLPDQLSPLSEKQLRLRLTTLGRPSDPSDERAAYSRGGRLAKKAYLLDLLASCYREGLAVRVVRRITAGIALPADRTSAVLEALRHADFGKKGGGKSRNVEAQKYTVLGRAASDAPHKVSAANQHLCKSSDPPTCAAPQQSSSGSSIFVVPTLNKLVKVDGRFVHWVRSYPPTRTRYSLIYFTVDDAARTERDDEVYDVI
ncbi:hypothetical protein TrRE_jg3370 [Triparma retinervis]|uniref:Uncharacterized protein n=1 Tax=Triparma retinervis TaxID=2557542 RepID=A0A9W7A3I1_9STRA|nr:hypothetical protein TrRE_jg3370 [Triparma retinervis]